MIRRLSCCLLVGVAALVAVAPAVAGHSCGPPPCGPSYVERTVCVPQWVVEKRKVVCTEYRKEQREYKYTVYRCVPETKQVTRQYTVMVPERRQKEVTYTVCKPVVKEVEQQYTVCVPEWKEVQRTCTVMVPVWKEEQRTCTVLVPHKEHRVGTRRICKMVPVTEKRTICRDEGHWEQQLVQVPCGGGLLGLFCCAPACCTTTVCRNVWVPNIVKQEVEVTVCKPQIVEEQYEYDVIVCKPEQRTYTVKVCSYEPQQRTYTAKVCSYRQEVRTRRVKLCSYEPQKVTRTVEYVVCVPQTREQVCNVTTYKTVAEERTGTCTVLVPHQVEKEVEVKVCRMVPKKVLVPAGCGHCCW
ncbi:MAG: hypothetical protein D6743_16055 [Calditrichaeota bacterium]|nr:MAG: hypothetical protein D6743_16055 [Calditrichota bacterium]